MIWGLHYITDVHSKVVLITLKDCNLQTSLSGLKRYLILRLASGLYVGM